jgi:F-type H+-transporting ATPase subunit gamma
VANIRDLRQRIRSVGNIQKITRAMEMVATTKLRRFQTRTLAAKPYSGRLEELMRALSVEVAGSPEAAGEAASLFRPGNATAPRGLLLIASDRGLCGAYNSNLFRLLEDEMQRSGGKAAIYVIGRRGMAYCARRRFQVTAFFEQVNLERLDFGTAAAVSNALVADFRAGKISTVSVTATRFASMMKYVPEDNSFLPIAPAQERHGGLGETLLEPSGAALLGRLVRRYLETRVYHAMLEAVTSEYASRRFAMKNATEAAGDMKKSLTRDYNRARQARITTEILEIVSGAEAL